MNVMKEKDNVCITKHFFPFLFIDFKTSGSVIFR